MIKNKTRIFLLSGLMILLSLTSFGQNVRGFYLQDVGTWLGNTTKENEILNYAQGNGFNYILFYDLGDISWSNATQKNQLGAFFKKARAQYGITQIGGVVEYAGYVSSNLIPYNNSRTSAAEKFDVINLEFEFWVSSSISSSYCSKFLSPGGYACNQTGAWQFAWKQIKAIDDLCAANSMISEVYLGWPSLSQMQQIASVADRIFISAYRPNDNDIYVYSTQRMKDIATLGGKTKILTLLSSETSFMGPWLATHPQTRPFQTMATALNNETQSFKQNIDLQGYQWFTYKYMPKTILATAAITANGPLTFCPGGSVVLSANSGASYLWSPGGATTQSITVSNAGSYTVKVTNTSGASAVSLPVSVSNNGAGSVPLITASGPTSFCPGGSVTLSANPSTSYLWSTGETTQTINVNTSGSYTVKTVTGVCTGTSTPLVVNANASSPTPPVITSSGPTSFCPGGSVTLSTTAATSYLWSTGETTQSIDVGNTGSYTVTAVNGLCSGTSSAIAVNADASASTPPVINASGPTSFCSGGNVTLTTPSATAYLWSTGETTQSIVVSNSGSVTVTVMNGTCTGISSPIAINAAAVSAPPVITASGATSFCPGGSVTLSTTTASSYLWSTGETTQSIVVTASGSFTVSTTNGNCTGTSTPVVVNALAAPALPVITASGSLSICQGTILTLTSSQANGYLWSNGATTRSIVVSSAGDYKVTAYNSPVCYSQSAPKSVTLLAAPTKPTIAANSSTTLTTTHTSVILTSSTATTYLWSTNSVAKSITVTSQGNFRVTVTGANGCKATSDDVLVTANGCTPPPTPTITSSGSNVITSGQSVVLTSSLSGGYLWSNGAQTRSITVTTAGTFTVRSYNKGGCFSTSLPVTVTIILAREASNSTSDISEDKEVHYNLYPNPMRDQLNIDFNQAESKIISIQLMDVAGRVIQSMEVTSVIGENHFLMDVSEISKGIYFALLTSDDQRQTVKLIVE